jgi:hypothetical protein
MGIHSCDILLDLPTNMKGTVSEDRGQDEPMEQ